ncbi:response regulator transcription factor [Actinophytocola gossypii]|uniref:Response regulator transcription factor n=1 Tax=Actinophytocola gossypii TaxID=2812003 RepID=A0ABT2JAG3_9PSEU|nr:response regulator transcription factor [Actinophytocola gossypii]MCT2584455.1 response regulator transcription factor [Actinophytocola gossypii]
MSTPNAPVRLVVVDAQPLFARGLGLLLPAVSNGRVHLVASACRAEEAAGAVRRHRPDLALVDLGLAPPGGLRAIAAIRRTEPAVGVIAMRTHDTYEPALHAVYVGARGVVDKTAEPEELLLPLLAVIDGWSVLPNDVLARLSAEAGGAAREIRDRLDANDHRLWRLLASGRTLVQIAAELHVSERTVKRLTATLLRRLRVTTRAEAAALAGQAGLLSRPG